MQAGRKNRQRRLTAAEKGYIKQSTQTEKYTENL
jgi:hypothetical protein